jgi:hypothetical protein
MTLVWILTGLSIFGFGVVGGLTLAIWACKSKALRIEKRQRELDEVFCLKNRKHFPP